MSLGPAPRGGSPVTVLCALRGPAEARVVEALSAHGRDVNVTRRCADVRELRAAAASGLGAVALLAADLDGLDRELVADLAGLGVRVVAFGGSEHDARRAAGLGLGVLPASLTSEELVVELTSGADRPRGAGAGAADDEDTVGVGVGAPGTGRRAGCLVAVWGPTGAPGRTTVAVNLAAELAAGAARDRRGRKREVRSWRGTRASDDGEGASGSRGAGKDVLLVDADTYGGTVAQHLGMLDESPGLVAATRSAGRGTLDARGLAALSPFVAPRLRVLTGIARARRWPEVSSASLDQVWLTARSLSERVVVDCGFGVEQDESLTYDTAAPQRNGATLSALAAADVVVVVGGADPVGVHRLVRALEDLDDLFGAGAGPARARRVVVANRVRAGTAGPNPRAAVREVLARFAGLPDPVLVGDDQRAFDRALLEGRALRKAVPEATVRRELAAVGTRVEALLPASEGSGNDRGADADRAPASQVLAGEAH